MPLQDDSTIIPSRAEIPPPSILKRVFVGPRGIRHGWRVGIFLIALMAVTSAIQYPAKLGLRAIGFTMNMEQPLPLIIAEAIMVCSVFVSSLIMSLIEKKPVLSYGFDGPRRVPQFLFGSLAGAASLSILVGLLSAAGFLSISLSPMSAGDALGYAALWAVGFLLVALFEESLLRGYLQHTLSKGIGFWWSAIVLSAGFGLMHLANEGESAIGITAAALVGLVFCVSLWYLKNLWWAIGFHASWDWAQSYFWGTADSGHRMEGHLFAVQTQGDPLWSGGATGPEGSLFVIPLLVCIAIAMWYVWGRKAVAVELTQPAPTPGNLAE
jgi:uncharacterized protein